jgi:hypothetical protein
MIAWMPGELAHAGKPAHACSVSSKSSWKLPSDAHFEVHNTESQV